MRDTERTKMSSGEFDSYFEAIFGARWPALRAALEAQPKQCLRSCFGSKLPDQPIEWLPGCTWFDANRHSPPKQDEEGLLSFYVMDPASVLAARALEPAPDSEILDLCAAPGGKTLVLLALLKNGRLVANEPSRSRRERLMNVIRSHTPRSIRDLVSVSGKDGTRLGTKALNQYDRILVDAPCSGERHLLSDPKELKTWTPARTRQLARRQYALLASALLATRPGGLIVYSTCALSPTENDDVVQRLLKRKSDQVTLDLPEAPSPFSERTEFGYLHLPDRSGFGPLYFSRLKKKLAQA